MTYTALRAMKEKIKNGEKLAYVVKNPNTWNMEDTNKLNLEILRRLRDAGNLAMVRRGRK